MHYSIRHAIAAGAIAAFASCATPVAPTGGPVDSTPPSIVATIPEANTTGFRGEEIVFRFSERVDARSFQQAFSITPEPTVPPEISARRSRVTVRFQEPLRDSTTYIFSLDNNLTDLHNVSLERPLTVAVSTGDKIDEGRIYGMLKSPRNDAPVASIDIFAFQLDDTAAVDVSTRMPDFRTQTGTDGRFALAHLPERPFFVLAVDDRNRNRTLDAVEAFAVPSEAVTWARRMDSTATTTAVESLPLFVTRIDTIGPSVQRVVSRSVKRLQLRYNEPLSGFDRDPSRWSLADSIDGTPKPVRTVFSSPADPRVVELVTDSPAAGVHRIIPAAVTDTAGNDSRSDTLFFTPVERADTTVARFAGFLPRPAFALEDSLQILVPGRRPGIRFTIAPETRALDARLRITGESGQSVSYSRTTDNGVDYTLSPASTAPLASGILVQWQSDVSDTTYARWFRTLPEEERGEIDGVVAADSLPIVVELFAEERSVEARRHPASVDATGVFVVRDLPEGAYYLRYFADRDGNGKWSGGSVKPYISPESLVWYSDSLIVRPRWTTSLPDTLVLPDSVP